MDIITKYNLKENKYFYRGNEIKIFQTENIDSLLDKISDEQFDVDERFPYFVKVWDSGYNLAKYFIEEFDKNLIRDKKYLELGSGSGIVGIALCLNGAKVVFSDYEIDSLSLCKINANANNITEVKLLSADWRNFPEVDTQIDYLIASDIFYENRFLLPLIDLTKRFLDKGTKFILSDPGREYCQLYLDCLNNDDYKVVLLKNYKNQENPVRDIRIYQIEKSL